MFCIGLLWFSGCFAAAPVVGVRDYLLPVVFVSFALLAVKGVVLRSWTAGLRTVATGAPPR